MFNCTNELLFFYTETSSTLLGKLCLTIFKGCKYFLMTCILMCTYFDTICVHVQVVPKITDNAPQ